VLPASTTLLIKKFYHLDTLHLYLAKTNKERVTEFLYQAVELPTSDCSIFTENETLVQISGDSRLKKVGVSAGPRKK